MSWMRSIMTKTQREELDQLIADFEERTGAELLVVFSRSSDPYPAAALRFAFLAWLIFSLVAVFFLEFRQLWMLFAAQLVVFFIASLVGRFAFIKKFLVIDAETRREVDEKAVEVYYRFGHSQVNHNSCILFYVSIWEKQLKILVGSKIEEKLQSNDLENLTQRLTQNFSGGRFWLGAKESIELLEQKLHHLFPNKVSTTPPNELANKAIWLDFSS